MGVKNIINTLAKQHPKTFISVFSYSSLGLKNIGSITLSTTFAVKINDAITIVIAYINMKYTIKLFITQSLHLSYTNSALCAQNSKTVLDLLLLVYFLHSSSGFLTKSEYTYRYVLPPSVVPTIIILSTVRGLSLLVSLFNSSSCFASSNFSASILVRSILVVL